MSQTSNSGEEMEQEELYFSVIAQGNIPVEEPLARRSTRIRHVVKPFASIQDDNNNKNHSKSRKRKPSRNTLIKDSNSDVDEENGGTFKPRLVSVTRPHPEPSHRLLDDTLEQHNTTNNDDKPIDTTTTLESMGVDGDDDISSDGVSDDDISIDLVKRKRFKLVPEKTVKSKRKTAKTKKKKITVTKPNPEPKPKPERKKRKKKLSKREQARLDKVEVIKSKFEIVSSAGNITFEPYTVLMKTSSEGLGIIFEKNEDSKPVITGFQDHFIEKYMTTAAAAAAIQHPKHHIEAILKLPLTRIAPPHIMAIGDILIGVNHIDIRSGKSYDQLMKMIAWKEPMPSYPGERKYVRISVISDMVSLKLARPMNRHDHDLLQQHRRCKSLSSSQAINHTSSSSSSSSSSHKQAQSLVLSTISIKPKIDEQLNSAVDIASTSSANKAYRIQPINPSTSRTLRIPVNHITPASEYTAPSVPLSQSYVSSQQSTQPMQVGLDTAYTQEQQPSTIFSFDPLFMLSQASKLTEKRADKMTSSVVVADELDASSMSLPTSLVATNSSEKAATSTKIRPGISKFRPNLAIASSSVTK